MKEVEGKTEGAVQIKIVETNEAREALSALSKKEKDADIVIADLADLKAYDEKIDVSALPFLFKDYEYAHKFLQSDPQESAESKRFAR